VIAAVDYDAAAVRTYAANLGSHVIARDLTKELELPTATVVIGGPPCQGFSSAGLRKSADHRNTLVGHFAHIVTTLRPLAFVFENVEGFLTSDDGYYILDLLTPLIALGYRVRVQKVNAANYGVPQHRKRVVAIGGLGWDPSFPAPSHSAYGAPGARLAARHLPLTPTLSKALEGLPLPTNTEPGTPSGHFYRPLHGIDLERARALKPGQRMRDLPHELWHDSYRRRAFRRVMDGTPTDRRGGAPTGILRLRMDEPSKAITGGARSEFLHPDEDRNLTLRECARLQTFPDDFVFEGTMAERSQVIGNAVPPRLAEALARSLASDLETARPCPSEGALLSFVPTLSTGMSPALQRITAMVNHTFSQKTTSARQLTLWR